MTAVEFAPILQYRINRYPGPMLPLQTVQRFDAFLASLGVTFDAVVVGGSALVLLRVIDRPTKDVDVMHPQLPKVVADAARAFAAAERTNGVVLSDDWLNSGPQSLASIPWVSFQDANPLWPEHVRQTFENLRERLGHGV